MPSYASLRVCVTPSCEGTCFGIMITILILRLHCWGSERQNNLPNITQVRGRLRIPILILRLHALKFLSHFPISYQFYWYWHEVISFVVFSITVSSNRSPCLDSLSSVPQPWCYWDLGLDNSLLGGAALCIVGCLSESIISTPLMPVASPQTPNVCWGTKLPPFENYRVKESLQHILFQMFIILSLFRQYAWG